MRMKAIDPRNVMALLEYLDSKPHREVRHFIDMLGTLPEISPPKDNESEKPDLKVVT